MALTTDPRDSRLSRHLGADDEPVAQDPVYLVLSEAERARGVVRPLRRSYRHEACHMITTMGEALCETYARDPKFYTHTYCAHCYKHRPVGEFTWVEDGRTVGS